MRLPCIPNAVENTPFQLAKAALGPLIAANGIGQTLGSMAACMCVSMNPVFPTVIGQRMGAKGVEAADWYMRKPTRCRCCRPYCGTADTGPRARDPATLQHHG